MTLLFTLLVVLGFLFHFIATFPNSPYASRVAWGLWFAASVFWAAPLLGLR